MVLFTPCKPGDPNPLYVGRWYLPSFEADPAKGHGGRLMRVRAALANVATFHDVSD
jgi:hypothetical protein